MLFSATGTAIGIISFRAGNARAAALNRYNVTITPKCKIPPIQLRVGIFALQSRNFHQSCGSAQRGFSHPPFTTFILSIQSCLNLEIEARSRYISRCSIKTPSSNLSALAAYAGASERASERVLGLLSHESRRENRANLISPRVKSVRRAKKKPTSGGLIKFVKKIVKVDEGRINDRGKKCNGSSTVSLLSSCGPSGESLFSPRLLA